LQDFARFADLAVSLVNGTAHDLQDFLMEPSVPERMLKALAIVKKELELLQLQKDISRRVEEKFTKEQKRYFLMEQMKHIQKELGITKDEKAQVIQKFLDRFNPVKCDSLPSAALSHSFANSKIADMTHKNVILVCLAAKQWGFVRSERLVSRHACKTHSVSG
jgi:ATP-dependent Lon protease